MSRIRRIVAVAAIAVLATTGLAACSNDSSESASSTTSTGVPAEPTTKPDRLVIRIWSGDQEKVYADTAAKMFTEDTGIPIVWDTTDEAVSYAKLNQEISSGQRPSADASFNAQQRAYTNAARGWTIPINPAAGTQPGQGDRRDRRTRRQGRRPVELRQPLHADRAVHRAHRLG